MVLTAIGHFIRKFHVVIDRVIDLHFAFSERLSTPELETWTYSLNAIGIIHRKFRIVLGLNSFINNAINDTQSVEVKLDAFLGAICNLKILFVEVVKELQELEVNETEFKPAIDSRQAHSV